MEDDLQTIWLNDDLCEARDFRDENEPFLNDDDIIITIICWNERIHDFHCRQQMETRIHKFHMKFLPLAVVLVFIYRVAICVVVLSFDVHNTIWISCG